MSMGKESQHLTAKHPRLARAILVFLVVCIVAGLAPAARAESMEVISEPIQDIESQTPLNSEDEALARAKLLPFVSADMLPRDVHLRENLWQLLFLSPELDDNGDYLKAVSVDLDAADGAVNSLSMQGRNLASSGIDNEAEAPDSGIDWEQAEQVAYSFIDSLQLGNDAVWIINPYREADYDLRYDDKSLHKVRFNRAVNGIRVNSQQFILFVNQAGDVVSYQMNWEVVDFAEPADIISLEEAQNRIFDQITPVLQFLQYAEAPTLVYSIWQTTLDPVTGEFPENKNNKPYYHDIERLLPVSEMAAELAGSPEPTSAIDETAARIAAVRYIQATKPDYIHQLAEHPNLYEGVDSNYGNPQHVFHFFRVVDGISAGEEYIQVSVDQNSGRASTHLSTLVEKEYPEHVTPPALTQEQAKRLLLSIYDVELQYFWSGISTADLYYQLILNPSVPIPYSGARPLLDANSGQWWHFYAELITNFAPPASTWVDDVISSVDRIEYEAAIVLNGQLLPFDHQPVIEDERTLVPFRQLLEALEAAVSWDGETRQVVATKENVRLELEIDSDTAYINGVPYQLAVAAQLINDSTYVPVRFIAEAFGAEVAWEAESRLVRIDDAGATAPSEVQLKQWRLQAQKNWDAKSWPLTE